jgi:hypothetical protein
LRPIALRLAKAKLDAIQRRGLVEDDADLLFTWTSGPPAAFFF